MKNKDKLEALVMEACRSHKERSLMYGILGELQTSLQRITSLEQELNDLTERVATLEGSTPPAPKVTKKPAAKKESTDGE